MTASVPRAKCVEKRKGRKNSRMSFNAPDEALRMQVLGNTLCIHPPFIRAMKIPFNIFH